MIIQDGNRLIFITEDEEMKKKLLELDGSGDIVYAPLEPPPELEIKIPYDSDVVADAKVKAASEGIKGTMEVYGNISTMPQSRDRQELIILCKKEINRYLMKIKNNGKETLLKLNADIGLFIRPTLKEVLRRYVYADVNELAELESNRVLTEIVNLIIRQGLERCR